VDISPNNLPAIPAKRYFTIGEVSELCGVKPHVLRYWEQEFTQLKPVKRRGNRRYYQHHEVLLIRRIRELLYDQGFTISGARNRLEVRSEEGASAPPMAPSAPVLVASTLPPLSLRQELLDILALLDADDTTRITESLSNLPSGSAMHQELALRTKAA
jgi:DNA-binding transcriptional MerR regulator